MDVRLTGVSTPFGGISWEYTKRDEKEASFSAVFAGVCSGVRAESSTKPAWFKATSFTLRSQ